MVRIAASGALIVGSVLGATRAASAQTVANIAARGACDTSGVVNLSDQLVNVQMCLNPGAFVAFTPHSNVTLTSSHIHAYLGAAARDALWRASGSLDLRVNSAFRTLADQYVLYYSHACGLAATPGNSNHETGRAVDLDNWSAAVGAMTAAGCTHTYPSSDPVHFDCPGTDLRADSIRAFQHLWNVNNPGDMIAEDGAYGPMTESRLARSPANGFANPGSCGAPAGAMWAGQYVMQSFPLASAPPITMHVGDTLAGYIEMRNTGTHAWDSNTHLATTVARDRSSGLAGSDWLAPNRPAGVTGTVAMGGTFRFNFSLHANAVGTYDEHFGMVEDGVAWFSDPGQGGPADNLLEVRVNVLAADPDGGVVADDAGTTDDGGVVANDASGGDDVATSDDVAVGDDVATEPVDGGPSRADGGDAGGDAMRLPDGALMPGGAMGGCGCDVPGRGGEGGSRGGALVIALGAAAVAVARRRRRS